MTDRDSDTSKPGPEPERLKLDEDDWKEALREALESEPPAEDDEASEEGDATG